MNLAKVLLLIVVGIYLIGNFQPYYDVWDSYNYANSGIQISKGNYGFTNSLLNQTGFWEFVPPGYTLSIHGTAIPITMFGMPLLTAIAYLIGGYSEILIDASKKELRITEEKITVIYDTGGKTSTKNPVFHSGDVLGSLIELIALKHPLRF